MARDCEHWDPIAELFGIASLWDEQLPFVPAGFARREIHQESTRNGQRMAGRRVKELVQRMDEIEYEASPTQVDRARDALIDAGLHRDSVEGAADHIKQTSFARAPDMDAGHAPPIPEALANAVPAGGVFMVEDIIGHGVLQAKVETPAYYAGKNAVSTLGVLVSQLYWGRQAVREEELKWWTARLASLLTVEYYTWWIPTIEGAEPWTAPLWNEEASCVAGLGPLPTAEDPVTTVFFGLGHMAGLKDALDLLPAAPPLPTLDIPLPGEGYRPTFQG